MGYAGKVLSTIQNMRVRVFYFISWKINTMPHIKMYEANKFLCRNFVLKWEKNECVANARKWRCIFHLIWGVPLLSTPQKNQKKYEKKSRCILLLMSLTFITKCWMSLLLLFVHILDEFVAIVCFCRRKARI